ncbi:MAG: T9SS type A sorting domain-containing protein [Acidobacteriota bacterium]
MQDSCSLNYLVGYANATDITGKIERVPYGGSGTFTKWVSGFDEINLYCAKKAVGTSDSLVYVANNDPDHNILVFKLTKDTTASTDWRMKTGTDDIQGLAVDNNGYVYVCAINGTAANTKEIKIFKGIKAAGTKWGTSYDDTPVATIDLPAGTYRGLAVSGDGKMLFVSNMADRSVIKFTGSPATGYTKATGFAFTESINDTIPTTQYDTLGTKAWDLGRPLGMAYLNGNNILYVATARWLSLVVKTHNNTNGYTYSKILGLNPMTGKVVDSIDVAKYYYEKSDTTGVSRSYTRPVSTDNIHIAGYASSYDIGFDEKKNLYSTSMYGWAVEGWKFTGTLPTVPATSVERTSENLPSGYELSANYPNPFNPSTSFRFAVASTQHVSICVYDMLGREVAQLVNGEMKAGTYTVQWNASNVPSGVYIYKMTAGGFTSSKKMTLMK